MSPQDWSGEAEPWGSVRRRPGWCVSQAGSLSLTLPGREGQGKGWNTCAYFWASSGNRALNALTTCENTRQLLVRLPRILKALRHECGRCFKPTRTGLKTLPRRLRLHATVCRRVCFDGQDLKPRGALDQCRSCRSMATIMCLFSLAALLRYNSPNIQVTHLKCAIERVYISQLCNHHHNQFYNIFIFSSPMNMKFLYFISPQLLSVLGNTGLSVLWICLF